MAIYLRLDKYPYTGKIGSLSRIGIIKMHQEIEPILVFVKRNLSENKGLLTKIAIECGVPYSTLIKISQGVIENPRIETVQKLFDYFTCPAT